MGITENLARFVVETQLDEIPKQMVETCKGILLSEGIGAILAGTLDESSNIITKFVRDLGGKRQAGVIGRGFRTTVPQAALVNGTASHAADYDGGVRATHIGFILPSVLALAESVSASGKELLEAYIIALEVESRIASVLGSVQGSHYTRGWHPTSTIGTLAAAVGCAKILKLDCDKTRLALGIAVSEAGGVRQNFGTMTKPFHAGMAARNGVIAAMLAKRGFTADLNILEERFGFYNVFCDNGMELKPVIDGLGKKYDSLSNLDTKKYPCCLTVHTALDAILDILNKHSISPENIKSIECKVFRTTPQIAVYNDPKTALQGKFSMPFCIAVAVLEREVGISQFTNEKVSDPQIQDMMKKVSMVIDPEMNKEHSSLVTINLLDGTRLSERVDVVPGSPGKPLTDYELVSKYKDCARQVLSKPDIEKSITIVEHLEQVDDVATLVESVLVPNRDMV